MTHSDLNFRALQLKLAHFDQDVSRVFDTAQLPEPLNGAARYAMASGGKRARPLLAVAAFGLNSKPDDSAQDMLRRSCLALELLHGYSLAHDDLPSMDNDALRRGRPTCHIVYGENVALLVGDVLQSLSFEVLKMALPDFLPADDNLVVRLLQVFAPRARRMVAGQMLDVVGENRSLNQAELEAIHTDKTGALIQAALLMGGICAGLDAQALEKLSSLAGNLGLAFQVQDDVLDVMADTQTLGKPAGSDDKLQKSTYVKLMGLSDAQSYADSLYAQVFQTIADLAQASYNTETLSACVAWLKHRQS